MTIKANWNYPTAVRFGAGRIAELPDALKAAGIKKPLLVTDAGLASLPVTQNALKVLREAGFEVGL
ncbi:MAG TPA: iron-containing alcohol dehydrogenase, partial [Devosia sp.]|nr:iron-containing alcohol dehydrogenase [Devosia sp.]